MAGSLRRPTTVRVRLTILAALLVGLGLVAGGLVMLALVRHNLMENAENDALNRARSTVEMLAADGLPATLPSSGENPAVVQVVDRDGRVLMASEALRGKPALLSRWPGEGVLTATLKNVPIGERGDYTVVGLAASRAGEPVAVYAASALEPVSEGVGAAATALAVVVPVLLIVVAGTAWLLVGRALRPVEAIRERVTEITAKELDRRVPEPPVQDEVGRLARTMNEMLARLQDAHDRQRRFVGDASHELRSPLAAIRTRVEVGLAHPADTDWVRLAQSVHREGARLEHLVDDLLVLSRTDAAASTKRGGPEGLGGGRDATPPVDLDEVVLEEVESVRARGKVSVELAPFSAARLPGRRDDLRRMVRNLLDNAERHADRAVVVGLSTEDGTAELVVRDDGAGIPPEHAEQVFERFFRLQPGRDRDSGGAGLGLAIVRDVAIAYGGRTWLAPTEVGAEFHVRLPAVPQAGR
jgi:signal transduction histidine kinase